MSYVALLAAILISNTSLTIIHPENGETYSDDRLDIRVIVENENELIVTAYYESTAFAADTIRFKVIEPYL